MKVIENLLLWIDPVKRPGPEAMAVDEWLLENAEAPVLRIYGWQGEWGSLGYFGKLEEARASFPGIQWVRRRTGGGTVDHRADWTYSVVVPAGVALAGQRGAESYRRIHAALAEALNAEGMDARMSRGLEETGAAACFENPVTHDLMDNRLGKLAGAGQHRSRRGLLHQGSVAAACSAAVSLARGERLSVCLAVERLRRDFDPPAREIEARVRDRYALAAWTERR